jgi:hypothetical protein
MPKRGPGTPAKPTSSSAGVVRTTEPSPALSPPAKRGPHKTEDEPPRRAVAVVQKDAEAREDLPAVFGANLKAARLKIDRRGSKAGYTRRQVVE